MAGRREAAPDMRMTEEPMDVADLAWLGTGLAACAVTHVSCRSTSRGWRSGLGQFAGVAVATLAFSQALSR